MARDRARHSQKAAVTDPFNPQDSRCVSRVESPSLTSESTPRGRGVSNILLKPVAYRLKPECRFARRNGCRNQSYTHRNGCAGGTARGTWAYAQLVRPPVAGLPPAADGFPTDFAIAR